MNYAGSQSSFFGSLFLPILEQPSPFFWFFHNSCHALLTFFKAAQRFPLLLAANTFHLHCSVFKVQSPVSVETRYEHLSPLSTRIRLHRYLFGVNLGSAEFPQAEFISAQDILSLGGPI